ncbi:ATP-grasp domain-containing protein [Mesorhizobium sp. M7A.F.Ca.CA.001.09.2.1]|uniref:Acetyl-CoA carboxylase biotin carboxylase subunit family protein n=1 Tax=Mesorhizobium ciceri TaxID=39645 RepID=A0AB38TE62_9HYPH|nr:MULTISPECIES: acetyl-CoA carboxylase biotin carboxylase subunit family protein [Mesorhizobium]RUY59632.1 ATP-grasp domain-containing protein [Mesorhizobium sp. M7A.F.Ca.CA.001.13.2.1]MDF3218051.1 acetyl-CoA carboxylase biotin carboxylase subunit family protein [Mesorhizobium ciceri]RUY70264.1 ATP-grasp domain-containing protein [Mesorhizobium sp. M7A.F.Ca.CA.001.13.1.1]RUY71221.1 ATP-grasp domain-containing protein [Mesorhizobium sp. M7A.F.Ca.CA.001.05.1.1]RUY81238.1 ATP-grasp domain-contai
MVRRALILVEGGPWGCGLLYVQAAQRLGLRPIILSADPASSQYDNFAAEKTETIRVDTDDLDALIRECSRLRAIHEIAGITSQEEEVYATVGKLCQYFELPGPNPASIERCCDKFTQRELLAEAGVPVPVFRVAASATEAERAAAEIGLPVILKPTVGGGSSGVRLCRNVDELTEHAKYLLDGKHIRLPSPAQRKWQSSPRVLVEEFAEGTYYAAEIMGNELIGIGTGDFGRPPHFVYRGFTFPAVLTDDERKRIADVSLSCLQALGLGWGPTNVELRWTKRGPVVIEVNWRLAGTPTPQLVNAAWGVDLVTEHIKLAIGDECDSRRRHSHTAAARFLVANRDGTLDWIDGNSQAAAVSGVAEVKFYAALKTPIVRKGDWRDCIGHVIAASPDLAQTEEILQRAIDLINWSITPFPTLGD